MNLKQRIANCGQTTGSCITIGNMVIVEIMTRAGFDWLAVDMEHSVIALNTAQELIRSNRAGY